jgi:hypothetical protein
MFSCDIPDRTSLLEKSVWFALGFSTIAVLQAVGGWWLNSGDTVLRVMLALLGCGVLVGLSRVGKKWVRASCLWLGVMSASTVVLFRIGPGNIWPIVLATAAGLSAAAVFGGVVLGALGAGFRRPPSQNSQNTN